MSSMKELTPDERKFEIEPKTSHQTATLSSFFDQHLAADSSG